MPQLHSKQKTLVFRPLMDWWVALLVLGFELILLVSIPMTFSLLGLSVQSIVTVLFLLGAIIYSVDIAFYSVYLLDKEGLVISSHFRQASFPYRSMSDIRHGGVNALLSWSKRKRFALSRRNLVIRLRYGHYRIVSVSPQNQEAFLREIIDRVDQERTKRSSRASR